MDKNTIAYYVSSHGFGHLTRSLALIEYIFDTTDHSFYICSGKNHIEFAKIYLAAYEGRVEYSEFVVDVGIVNYDNSLEVDVEATNRVLYKMLETYEPRACEEAEKLTKAGVRLILNDVSAFPCLISQKTGIKVISIGNFTWVDQYQCLGAAQDAVDRLKEMYGYCDCFIAYDCSLNMVGAKEGTVFRSDYLTSRPLVESRIASIKQTYTQQYMEKFGKQPASFMYVSVGVSAYIPEINITNFEGVVFYTNGITFDPDKYQNILFVLLPFDIKDSQSFVAASDLVIAKAGWSTSAEGVVAHAKTMLIERPGVDDDMNTINTLKDKGLATSLTADEVIHLDYKKLYERAITEIDLDKLSKVKNDVPELCERILSYID